MDAVWVSRTAAKTWWRRFSGGLRRRVEIAKALLHRPQVLLMDEASTGLDPAARRELSRHVEELRDAGRRHHSAHHAYFGRSRPLRPSYFCCTRDASWPRAAPAELRARIGGDVVVLQSRLTRSRWPDQIAQRFARAAPPRSMARCAWRSPTAIALLPRWWRRFPAPSNSVGLHKPSLGGCLRERDRSGN